MLDALESERVPTPVTDDILYAQQNNTANVQVLDTPLKGRGVFAARRFAGGDTVVIGLIVGFEERRTCHSIQMDWQVHALFNEPAVLINHSCAPNTAVRSNRFGAYDFVALRAIAAGEEVTFDYATTEYVSIAVTDCRCGAPECRGSSGGFATLPADHPLRRTHLVGGYLAPCLTNKDFMPPIAGS